MKEIHKRRMTPEELKATLRILASTRDSLVTARDKAYKRNWLSDYLHLDKKIQELDEKMLAYKNELKAYDKVTLQSIMPKEGPVHDQIIRQLMEISLASDYLMQTIEDFRDILSKLDIESADIFKEVKELSTRSNKMASRLLTDKSQHLSNLLLEDDELLHSLSELTKSYIKSKTNL